MVQVMGSGKRKIQPKDLFKFADETETVHKDPNSPEARAMFDKMQKLIDKQWQR